MSSPPPLTPLSVCRLIKALARGENEKGERKVLELKVQKWGRGDEDRELWNYQEGGEEE